MIEMDILTQKSKSLQESTSCCKHVKNEDALKVVSELRGTEETEKDEGSLIISIVPIERWEISPMKASK
jgi:hypothetical protein